MADSFSHGSDPGGGDNLQSKSRQDLLDELSRLRSEIALLRQKQAESTQTQSQLNLMVSSSIDAIVSLNEERVVINCNPAFLAIFGYNRDEIIGHSIRTIHISDDSFNEFGRLAYDQLKAEGSWRGEWQYQRKDKSLVTLESAFSVQQGGDGKTLGYVSVMRDITERKQIEQKLKESEERLRTLINSTPDIICFKDARGRWLEANDADLELFSLEHVDYRGKTDCDLARFTDPIYRDAFLACEGSDDEAWSKRGILRGEEIIPRLDGSTSVYDVIKVPLFEANGERKGLIVLGRDVTERKLAERALKASEEKFRTIFENKGTATGIFGENAIIKECNAEFEKLSGYAKSEIIKKMKWSDFVVKEDLDRMLKFHAQRSTNVGNTPPSQYECSIVNRAGERRNVIVNVSMAGSDRIVSLIDITTRKQADFERQKLQARLNQAQKMEAIGTLAGGIAHDFNNILAAIIGYSELALEDADQGMGVQQDIEQILKAAGRAKELVLQILAFSRKAESKQKLLDINKVISRTITLIERTFPKMISVESDFHQRLSQIKGDPNQLEQVLLNLATNAKDAMPDGGKLIINTADVYLDQEYASSHPGAEPGNYLQITFSDTGEGMEKEVLEQIFDPFYTTKGMGKGTGLGLSSAYGIVKSHGGYITCRSEPGVGTEFEIYLPNLKPVEQLDSYSEDANTDQAPRGSETILLVDDEKSLREVGSRLLMKRGYGLMTAASGEDALAVYRESGSKIDLVILDISMPGMGGHKCLQEILGINPSAKVVIASGYSRYGELQETLKHGAAGYIAKPFNLVELLNTVRDILDG